VAVRVRAAGIMCRGKVTRFQIFSITIASAVAVDWSGLWLPDDAVGGD
jgi:hypothetical protein